MNFVYINYPDPHLTVHGSSECPELRKHGKPSQRVVEIDYGNFLQKLQEFHERNHRFGSSPETNDMWLYIDLPSREQEIAIVWLIQMMLAKHYNPFIDAPMKFHDCQMFR